MRYCLQSLVYCLLPTGRESFVDEDEEAELLAPWCIFEEFPPNRDIRDEATDIREAGNTDFLGGANERREDD